MTAPSSPSVNQWDDETVGAAAATQGPWVATVDEDDGDEFNVSAVASSHDWGQILGKRIVEEMSSEEDADFIAHAREDIPVLIALARSERDRADKAEARMEQARRDSLRTLELDREFLQQVANAFEIRRDEVTVAFLARYPSALQNRIQEASEREQVEVLELVRHEIQVCDVGQHSGQETRAHLRKLLQDIPAIRAAAYREGGQ